MYFCLNNFIRSMERSNNENDSVELIPNTVAEERKHIIILHEKLTKRKSDRYIINLAIAFEQIGFKVTIFTSQYDTNEFFEEYDFLDRLEFQFSGWWIPRSLFGLFKSNLSALRAAWMAFRLIFYPPKPKPVIVILDFSMLGLYLLSLFTQYKLFYLENFTPLKHSDACFEHSRLYPTLLEAKWLKLANEVLVETVGFAEILKKSYPQLGKSPIVLYPSIDLGLWSQPGIKIQRIVPDLLENTIIFLTIGKYRRSSNFKLALDAFEILLDLIDDKAVTKRFQLVIAGNCKLLEEKLYYNEMLMAAKEKVCASQITFLKQLPIVHEKTLIVESAIVIHPAKNDVYSDFLLKAMCEGKPIVGSNKGIASKILTHRLSGIIVEPEARIFAIAMKKLMMSPHLQIFLGDMAKDTFRKGYSFSNFCENLILVIKRNLPSTISKMSRKTINESEQEPQENKE